MSPIKLTPLDKKLLYYLDYRGKAQLTEIAEWMGTSPQVIKYRLERLLEKGVIKNFLAFCDYNLCGAPIGWGYWLSFDGLTREKEVEFYSYIEKHSHIPIIMKSSGYADVMIAIVTKDIFTQDQTLLEVLERFSPFVHVKEMVVGVSFYKLGRKYFYNGGKTIPSVSKSGTDSKVPKLDALDRKILSVYQLHGRTSYEDAAKVIGVPVSTVRNRYEDLLKNNVILNTTFTLDYQKIGIKMQRNLLKLRPDRVAQAELFEYCKKHPNVVNFIHIIGQSNLLLDIEAETPEQLHEVKQQLLFTFPALIKEYNINNIHEVTQFSQMSIEYPEIAEKVGNSPWMSTKENSA